MSMWGGRKKRENQSLDKCSVVLIPQRQQRRGSMPFRKEEKKQRLLVWDMGNKEKESWRISNQVTRQMLMQLMRKDAVMEV